MIKIRTLVTLLAVTWLAAISGRELFVQCHWQEVAQASDLAARWAATHCWRCGLVALLLWHLIGGLTGR